MYIYIYIRTFFYQGPPGGGGTRYIYIYIYSYMLMCENIIPSLSVRGVELPRTCGEVPGRLVSF